MAKIRLTDTGYTLLPEGVTTFKIVDAEYNEDFGKIKISLQTKEGKKHFENFSLLTKSGEINEGALKAFSFFAKTALNNFSVEEIDEKDLIGCYISAEVKHDEFESNKEPGKMLKTVRLNNYAVAVNFDVSKANNTASTMSDDDDIDDLDDLDDFLND